MSYAMEFLSIITGAVSIILAFVAIWLTLHFKKQSDTTNQRTHEHLVELKTYTQLMSDGIFRELRQWGNTGRDAITNMTGNQFQNNIVQDIPYTESQPTSNTEEAGQ